jgi:hypothetical protein
LWSAHSTGGYRTCDDTVHADSLKEASDVGGADRDARSHLSVLARIAIVGHDSRDALGTGPAHGANHEEQLHPVLEMKKKK